MDPIQKFWLELVVVVSQLFLTGSKNPEEDCLQAMTPEQRLDRLERIAKLFARAGVRARSELQQKYEILLDDQMRNEASIRRYETLFARNEKRFAQLAESQLHTDRRLDALIEIVREGRRRNPSTSGQSQNKIVRC